MSPPLAFDAAFDVSSFPLSLLPFVLSIGSIVRRRRQPLSQYLQRSAKGRSIPRGLIKATDSESFAFVPK